MDVERPPAGRRTADRRRWIAKSRDAAGDQRWRRGMFRGSSVAVTHPTEWDQRHWTSRWLYRVGELVAHSSTGIVAAGLVLGWAIVGAPFGYPQWWQTVLYSVTGSITFVMVFVIQHTQERQTAAMQRKLDELLRASAGADNMLIAVEEAPDEHLQALAHLNLADRAHAETSAPVQ